MPYRPMPPCRVVGCVEPSAGRGLCRQHQAERDRVRRAEYDKTRPGGYARGYDQAWAAKRALFLRSHPSCELCGERATEPHHRVAKRDGGTDEWSNLQALCRPCHSRITARSQGFAKR